MKKFRQFVAGIFVGVLIMQAVPAIAKVGKETISVVYNNIKLEVNGIKTTMPNSVEPFIYNGTTYLPVRAVAEALGENVEYDNNTVYVGSRKQTTINSEIDLYEFLKKNPPLQQHNIYYKDNYCGESYLINRNEKIAIDNAIYTKSNRTSGDAGNMDITLNSNYSKLIADFIIPDDVERGSFMLIDASGNNKRELASSENEGNTVEYDRYYITQNGEKQTKSFYRMGKGSKPYHIEVDVTGVDTLRIEFNGEGVLANVKLIPLK